MLNQVLSLPVDFKDAIMGEEKNKIIIELDAIPFDFLHNNLIIDHRMCEEYSGVMGNIVICDNKFINSAHLISEFFDIDVDDTIIDLIFSIETSAILDEEIEKLACSYLINYDTLSLESILEVTEKGEWNRLLNLLKNGKKTKDILSDSPYLEISKIKDDIVLIGYDYFKIDGYNQSRFASKHFQEKGFKVILVEKFNEIVFQGYMIDLNKSAVKKISKRTKRLKIKFEKAADNVFFFRTSGSLTLKEFEHSLSSYLE